MRYWKRLNPDGTVNSVESYSYDLEIEGAIEIGETEFHEFVASLPPTPPEPVRDLAAEIDAITDTLGRIKNRLGM